MEVKTAAKTKYGFASDTDSHQHSQYGVPNGLRHLRLSEDAQQRCGHRGSKTKTQAQTASANNGDRHLYVEHNTASQNYCGVIILQWKSATHAAKSQERKSQNPAQQKFLNEPDFAAEVFAPLAFEAGVFEAEVFEAEVFEAGVFKA